MINGILLPIILIWKINFFTRVKIDNNVYVCGICKENEILSETIVNPSESEN